MKILRWIDKNFEETLITVFMGWFTFACIWQVFARFVLKTSVSWTEETAKYSFIWMTFVGAAVASKKDLHVRVDILEHLFGGPFKKALGIGCKCIFLAFAVIAAGVGVQVCRGLLAQPQKSPVMGISMVYVYAALPVGMGLTSLRQLQNIVREIISCREEKRAEAAQGKGERQE